MPDEAQGEKRKTNELKVLDSGKATRHRRIVQM
nr:MAG TPA: hypothetical protein [Bacteriophage sp.]